MSWFVAEIVDERREKWSLFEALMWLRGKIWMKNGSVECCFGSAAAKVETTEWSGCAVKFYASQCVDRGSRSTLYPFSFCNLRRELGISFSSAWYMVKYTGSECAHSHTRVTVFFLVVVVAESVPVDTVRRCGFNNCHCVVVIDCPFTHAHGAVWELLRKLSSVGARILTDCGKKANRLQRCVSERLAKLKIAKLAKKSE